MKLGFRAKFAVFLVLIIAGLSLVQSTEYGREEAGGDLGNCVPNCDGVRFLARDRNPDDATYVLRADAPPTYANMRLTLGRVNPGTERAYRAAFAFSNEELFPVRLNSITLSGVAADWVTLTLHRSSNRFAAQDTGPTLVIWDGPGADAPGVPHPFSWTLGTGDANMATAGDLGEYAVAGPDPVSNSRYISTLGPVLSVRPALTNKDFVWVEARVRVPPGTANALYTSVVFVVFDAAPAATAQFGRFQAGYNVQVARNWYFRDAFACPGAAAADILASVYDPDNALLYYTGVGFLCSRDTNFPNAAATIAGSPVATPQRMVHNPIDGRIYIGGDNRDFAAYNPITGAFTNLEPALAAMAPAWPMGDAIFSLSVDPAGNVYVGGAQRDFARWNIVGGTATSFEASVAATGWGAGADIRAVAFNPTNGLVYVGGAASNFVSFDPGGGLSTNREPVIVAAGWPTGELIRELALDGAGLVYIGGLDRDFVVYRPGPNTATNLEPLLTGVGWAPAAADIRAMAFDPVNNAIQLGGQNGEFARYNVAAGTATDEQPSITLFWGTGGASVINTMAFDSLATRLYLGGNGGRLAVYTPALGTGVAAADDLRMRRLLDSPPTSAVATSITAGTPAGGADDPISDGVNPLEAWAQVPKFALAGGLPAGVWTFNFNGCRSAAAVDGSLRVDILLISNDAVLASSTAPGTPVNPSWPVCGGTGLVTWAAALPALAVPAGDGIYIQLYGVVTAGGGGASLTLRFDYTAATPTGVVTP